MKCKILVVGGGTAGLAIASRLVRKLVTKSVYIIEPSNIHYNQSFFTLVGGGLGKFKQTCAPTAAVVPQNAIWIKDAAISINPNTNEVVTIKNGTFGYEYLIICMGIVNKYDKIPGLIEALDDRCSMVSTIYSPDYVTKTWDVLRKFRCGNAIFTHAPSPIKCPGAPQKICYIAEHYFRQIGVRDDTKVIFNTAAEYLFGIEYYCRTLNKICRDRCIEVNLNTRLLEIKPEQNIAIFEKSTEPGTPIEMHYDMLHVVPPQGTVDVLNENKELTNEDGMVTVDNHTLQHTRFPNIFAFGDCVSTPNSKTAAAVGAQSNVVYENLVSCMNGKKLTASYDGYCACPLVTGGGKCIFAEFGYDGKLMETFPIPQNEERRFFYFIKRYVLAIIYWNLLIKGWWSGPAKLRKILSVFDRFFDKKE